MADRERGSGAMTGRYTLRLPWMPEGTHLNVNIHRRRVRNAMWVGAEYRPDPHWLSAGYGGDLTLGVMGFQINFVWWPTDPEGAL